MKMTRNDLKVTWEPWVALSGAVMLIVGIFLFVSLCDAHEDEIGDITAIEEPEPERTIKWIPYAFCVPLEVEDKLESPYDPNTALWSDTISVIQSDWEFETGCPKPNYHIQMGIVSDGTVAWRLYVEK
jgi:hypothetical protein